MANFKRGKCRYQHPGANRGSDTSWRAKYGFRPIRITREHYRLEGEAWLSLWQLRGRHGNSGKRIGGHFSQMNSSPAWHDILYHTRPRRAKEKMLARAVVKGTVDPENLPWPLAKKPHVYYW